MLRKCVLSLGWLIVLSVATVAQAQVMTTAPTISNNPFSFGAQPFNPYSGIPGYSSAVSQLTNLYNQAARGSSSSSLNQLALRNAQAIMANTQPQPSSMGAARIGLGLDSASGSKPFSNYSPAPTVSPYLNLFRTDTNGFNQFNYSTLVQPMLQQQQLNQQIEQRQYQVARRLNSIAAQSEYNPQGSKDLYPTGHQTVFKYTGHYFPAAHPRQRRQR